MTRTKSLFICTVAASALVWMMSGAGSAQSSDSVIGTWKVNVAKSSFSPGPGFKSGTVTYTAVGDGVKVAVEGVGGNGEAINWGFTANYDGKEVPVTGNNPDADSASLKRIDAKTAEISYKKGGKPTLTSTRVLSADGRTVTVTVKGTNAKGQAVNNVLVLEKA